MGIARSWCSVLSNEAIKHQGKSKLYTQLIEIFDKLLKTEEKDWDKAWNMARIEIVHRIKTETGINVLIELDFNQSPNAAVQIPELDANNPLITGIRKLIHSGNSDITRLKQRGKKKLEGLIDYDKSKVSGIFSELESTLYITTGLFKNNYEQLTAEAIAGVVLHEVGHIFTYFSNIVTLTRMNYAIASVEQTLLGTNVAEERIAIIEEAEKYIDTKIEDKESLSSYGNGKDIIVHMVSSSIKNMRSEDGLGVFTNRNFEMLSDQFASRHGAGEGLAEFLYLIEKAMPFSISRRSKTVNIFFQALLVVASLIAAISALMAAVHFEVLVMVILPLLVNPQDKLYDKPYQRLMRIRNETNAELRISGPSKERKVQIIKSLKTIDGILSKLNDNSDWVEGLWNYILPGGRTEHKKVLLQQSLERIANTNLLSAGTSLELLA